ncbi:MAG: hypothetical protein ABII02_02175 [Candidatus Magasanikbacteria bacterium]
MTTVQHDDTTQGILIKKADGSTERVPLSQLKHGRAIKATAGSVNGDHVENPDPVVQPSVPAIPSAHVLPLAPKKNIRSLEPVEVEKRGGSPVPVSKNMESKDSQKRNTKKKMMPALQVTPVESKKLETEIQLDKDFSSPLEEAVDMGGQNMATLPQNRGGRIRFISKKLSFSVSEELQGRIESLAESRAKDIRTDDQVREYAQRPVSHGGLGFTLEQAEELVQVISHPETMDAGAVRLEPKIPSPTMSLEPAEPIFPSEPEMSDISPSTLGKPMMSSGQMHDVMAPMQQSTVVGPVQEIGMMTLVDFQRLGSDTATRVGIMKRKFDTLMAESYTEYLKARDAWFRSPLYVQYQNVVKEALNTKEPIPSVITSKGSITMDEFHAVLDIGIHLEL